MLVKFTPGPWHTAGERGEFVNDRNEMNICRVNPTVSWGASKSIGNGPYSHQGNAALIAAAPEMAMILLASITQITHGPTKAEVEALLRKAGII